MYLTLTSLKSRLGVSGNDRDNELNRLLDTSWATIVSDGHDFTKQTHSYITRWNNWYKGVALDYPNVTDITKVSDKIVSYTNKIDFLVKGQYNHIVVLGNDINETREYGDEIEVTYEAGFDTNNLPASLADAQFYLICGIKSDELQAINLFGGGKEIKDVTQGPRRVSYDTSRGSGYYQNKANKIFYSIFSPIELP